MARLTQVQHVTRGCGLSKRLKAQCSLVRSRKLISIMRKRNSPATTAGTHAGIWSAALVHYWTSSRRFCERSRESWATHSNGRKIDSFGKKAAHEGPPRAFA